MRWVIRTDGKVLLFWFLILFGPFSYAENAKDFTDADLKKVLAQNLKTDALIYSWSPHMNLSVRGLDELLKSPQNNGLVVLLDPNSNSKIAEEIVRTRKWPESVLRRNTSQILIEKGARVHYPNYIFISHGKLDTPILPGFKTSSQILEFKKRNLK